MLSTSWTIHPTLGRASISSGEPESTAISTVPTVSTSNTWVPFDPDATEVEVVEVSSSTPGRVTAVTSVVAVVSGRDVDVESSAPTVAAAIPATSSSATSAAPMIDVLLSSMSYLLCVSAGVTVPEGRLCPPQWRGNET